MPQVISIKTFIQVNALLFLLFYFFKKTLSNQLSNPSTNFRLGIKQPEFWTKS